MKDILRAITIEKKYLAHRYKGEYPFHLAEKIAECGFKTLEEYSTAKKAHQFGQLTFGLAYTPPSEAIAEIFRMMEAKETKVLFVESTETFVFTGESKAFDEEYCIENGIAIYPLYTRGGTIVSTQGDFSLVICMPDSVCSDVRHILDGLKAIFDKFMPNVEGEGNDILMNGGKICGSVGYWQNGMFCFGAHFSFNDNSELIEKICGASGSVKIPAAISGLTPDDFKQEVSAWLRLND